MMEGYKAMKNAAILCMICIMLAGCSLLTPKNEEAQAEAAVTAFFEHLSKGEYAQAADMYGAGYEELTYFNPNIPEDDHVALWRNICEVNGFQCLPVLRVIDTEKFSLNEFMVTVEFRAADGQPFVFGPCCGASEEEMPPETQFQMFAIERDGQYLVTSLPVFVP